MTSRNLFTAVVLLAVLALSPANAGGRSLVVTFDLQKVQNGITAQMPGGKLPVSLEVLDEFAKRTGTRLDKDLGFVGALADLEALPQSLVFFMEGTFDEAKFIGELKKEPGVGLEEKPLGALKTYVLKGQARLVVDAKRLLLMPEGSPALADAAALDKLKAEITALDRGAILTLAFRPTAAVKGMLLAQAKAAPPQAVKLLESLEALNVIVSEERLALTLDADPAQLGELVKIYEGAVAMLKMKLEGEEAKAREAMKDASAFKLLSPDIFGKLNGASAGRLLLEQVKVEAKGRELSIVAANPLGKSVLTILPIVGIVAAIAIPNFTKARNSAREKACEANMRVLEGACELMSMDAKEPPESFDIGQLVKGGYLKSTPTCPQDGTYLIKKTAEGVEVSCTKHGQLAR